MPDAKCENIMNDHLLMHSEITAVSEVRSKNHT